ncbi:MAG: putative RND superfamily exporter protein [Pseudohongiellaceae bacterium]|jgi:predicted RND superfamily exporter protein
MTAYLKFVQQFPKSILMFLVGITVFLGYMTLYLTEDSNPYLLPKDHPARSSLFEMRQDFTGTYDSILIALYNKEGILNQSSLQAIFELTEQVKTLNVADDSDLDQLNAIQQRYPEQNELGTRLKEITDSGLNQNDIYLVRALAIDAQQWSINPQDKHYLQVLAERLDPVRELAGLSASENVFLEADGTLRAAITVDSASVVIDRIARAVKNNELMLNGIIDPSEKVGLIVTEISVLETDAIGHLRAYDKVNKMVADYQSSHPEFSDEIYIAGTPVFFAEQKKILDRDMGTLFPLVLVLVSVVLLAFFRTFLGVVIPMINVIMCTVWTLGAMALVGIPLDLITSILPVFLITICSSDAIHVMSEYYYQRDQQQNQQKAVAATMRLMASPVILTTVTTCITFTLSTTSAISNLRNFGISMSFGMFVAMIISLLLIPAWLSLVSDKKLAQLAEKSNRKPLISQLLLKAIRPVMAHRGAFITGFMVILGALIVLATQVRIDDMGSGYFAKNNTYRIADSFVNSHIAGTSPGWIEVDTGEESGALTQQAVEFIDRLEKFIHQQENITYSYSVARYVRRINLVLNNMDERYNRLPKETEVFIDKDPDSGEEYRVEIAGKDIIRQSILLYENGGGSDLTNVLSEDFSKTLLLYTMNTTVASDYQVFLDKLRPWMETNIPESMSYKLAGSPVVWTAVLDELISSQLQSILLAFICVVLVMSLWMKSLRLGVLGTLPLLVTVICYYAAMTLFDIELNIGTAIISFLILGIVDYSVHYLLRTRHGLSQGLALDDALNTAITYSGRSIIANVIVFSVGFIALLFSEFRPIVDLGALVGLSLLISGVMSIFVITLLAPWFIPIRPKNGS